MLTTDRHCSVLAFRVMKAFLRLLLLDLLFEWRGNSSSPSTATTVLVRSGASAPAAGVATAPDDKHSGTRGQTIHLPVGEAAAAAIQRALEVCSANRGTEDAAEEGHNEAHVVSQQVVVTPTLSCREDFTRLRGALQVARYGLNLLTLIRLNVEALGDLLRDIDFLLQMPDPEAGEETAAVFEQTDQTVLTGLRELVFQHLLPRLRADQRQGTQKMALPLLFDSEYKDAKTSSLKTDDVPGTRKGRGRGFATQEERNKINQRGSSAQDHDQHENQEVYRSEKVPMIGFGTWRLNGTKCEEAVFQALQTGVRHLDTAESYGNHRCLRNAIKRSNVKREELFLTTKISNFHTFYEVRYEITKQLKILNTGYFDLVLIHRYPFHDSTALLAAWSGLEELVREDKTVRALGVSNFGFSELEFLDKNRKLMLKRDTHLFRDARSRDTGTKTSANEASGDRNTDSTNAAASSAQQEALP
ncbi:unnamed protein product, partial [Amoebophrya sp. A120]|eukprot:GSA120T00018435001.1